MDVFVIILESFTPVVLFYMVKQMTGNRMSAVGTAVIYSLAPGVLQASNAWNPNLIPLFGTLFIFGFLNFMKAARPLWLSVSLLSVTVLLNLHFQWFVLIPFIGILMIMGLWKFKTTSRAWLISVLIGVILLSPYIYSEATHNWHNTAQAVQFLTQEKVMYDRVSKPAYVLFFFPNFYQRMLFGSLFQRQWDYQILVLTPQIIIGATVFWMLFAAVVFAAWKKQTASHRAMLRWYIVLFIGMSAFLRFYKGDKLDYYLYIFLSFIFVFIGILCATYLNSLKRLQLVPFLVVGVLEGIAMLQITPFNDYAYYQNVTNTIVALNQRSTVRVEPLHQDLVRPLKYFLPDSVFATDPAAAHYVVSFCYASQQCHLGKPEPTEVLQNRGFITSISQQKE